MGDFDTSFGLLDTSFCIFCDSHSSLLHLWHYYFILLPRCSSNSSSIFPYLVGYGIIIPTTLLYPHYCIELLNMHNRVMTMNTNIVSTYPTFRCVEAMHGDPPAPPCRQSSNNNTNKSSFHDCSLSDYILYASLPVDLLCSPSSEENGNKAPEQQKSLKTHSQPFVFLKSTWNDVMKNAMLGILCFISLSILNSILIPFNWKLFQTKNNLVEEQNIGSWGWSLTEYLRFEHFVNNFAITLLFYLTINFGNKLLEATVNLAGYKTRHFMNSPLFSSKSPRDYWSRWNLLFHSLVKRGIYKPLLQQQISKTTAMILTFLVSGIFHEYIVTILTYSHDNGGNGDMQYYLSRHGGNLSFFLWNGILVFLDDTYGNQIGNIMSPITTKMPRFIQSVLVVCLALPFGHWVTNAMIESNYFDHLAMLLPIIVRVPPSTV